MPDAPVAVLLVDRPPDAIAPDGVDRRLLERGGCPGDGPSPPGAFFSTRYVYSICDIYTRLL